MEKILTIIEKYLDKCLTSLIIDDKELMRQLEVLVINDGSKNRSSEIAHKYESNYPDTFRVIDKENGNYGSCINRGLQEATGSRNCGNPHIACVIVTYNRKDQLLQCLNAVQAQTLKPVRVYITDNASTDGTMECVKQWGRYNCEKNGITYKYLLNERNEGGAGGFYLGMKTAYEDGDCDGIWVMDDDGCPESTCLENLSAHLDRYDNIAPLTLPFGVDDRLAFNCNGEFDIKTVIAKRAKDGVIEGYSAPFNAVLYSTRLIKKIGFPMKEMFIWGDEVNYTQRSIEAGAVPITVVAAVHRHPQDRMVLTRYWGMCVIPIEQRWKAFFFYRNFTYNYIGKLPLHKRIKYQIKQYLYLILSKRNLNWLYTFREAYQDGRRGDFSHTDKYRNLIGKK